MQYNFHAALVGNIILFIHCNSKDMETRVSDKKNHCLNYNTIIKLQGPINISIKLAKKLEVIEDTRDKQPSKKLTYNF